MKFLIIFAIITLALATIISATRRTKTHKTHETACDKATAEFNASWKKAEDMKFSKHQAIKEVLVIEAKVNLNRVHKYCTAVLKKSTAPNPCVELTKVYEEKCHCYYETHTCEEKIVLKARWNMANNGCPFPSTHKRLFAEEDATKKCKKGKAGKKCRKNQKKTEKH